MEEPLIHGLNHGVGGADALNAGLLLGNGDATNGANDVMAIVLRTTLAFPVEKHLPIGPNANYTYAFDTAPKGSPADFSTHGTNWFDMCDKDPDATANFNTGRFGIYTDHVELGTRKFGTATDKNLWIGISMDGTVGTAQIEVVKGLLIIGAETTIQRSNIVLGSGIAMNTTDTLGFLELPSMAGTPTGAASPHGASVPVVIDTAAGKLWARLSGTWKSVTFA